MVLEHALTMQLNQFLRRHVSPPHVLPSSLAIPHHCFQQIVNYLIEVFYQG
jgi:hypothetical protein